MPLPTKPDRRHDGLVDLFWTSGQTLDRVVISGAVVVGVVFAVVMAIRLVG